jgi:transcriptional regulator with XRE-family HTH domain
VAPSRSRADAEFLRDVGDRIRKRREQLGLSQEAMADAAGIDRSYMSGIERGTRNITLLKLRRLTTALRIPPRSLLGD